MKYKFLLILFLLTSNLLISRDIEVKRSLKWEAAQTIALSEEVAFNFITFDGARNNSALRYLPEFHEVIDLRPGEFIRQVSFAELTTERYNPEKPLENAVYNHIPGEFNIAFETGNAGGKTQGIVTIMPLKRSGNSKAVERIKTFTLDIEIGKHSTTYSYNAKQKYATNSVLANGQWFKFGVTRDGVYKINYDFLERLGLDPGQIDPANIRIYGNGGAMLPELNSEARFDDLVENPILVQGGIDGSFDKGDYVIFYGQGPDKWIYQPGSKTFRHVTHSFTDTSYYFITTDLGPGKRISNQASSGGTNYTCSSFNDYRLHEEDLTNLLHSGAGWYGEEFNIQTSRTFGFNFPNLDRSSPAYASVAVVAASKQVSSWDFNFSGQTLNVVSPLALGGYAQIFATRSTGERQFNATADLINVGVVYKKPPSLSSAKGWLDYIELNVRRQLILVGNQMKFRDVDAIDENNVTSFLINGCNSQTKVWDITDPLNPSAQIASLSGSQLAFSRPTPELTEYIVFKDYDSTLYAHGAIANQNLHAIDEADMVIVTHPLFRSASDQLAEFHTEEGLKVVTADINQIYNEFSSGARDIVAIRDFLRMIYNKSGQTGPRFLLLMGDGSYDNKGILYNTGNFIPTYQSKESFDPPNSYVSDDYYGLLDTNEGPWNGSHELIDVGIGRIPAQTAEEAQQVVNKILNYNTPGTMKDWRNIICFVGDDEDGNTHMRQSDGFAYQVDTTDRNFNVEKIFFDAYKQFSTPGGERYPEVNDAINRTVQRGALIMNYTGHGGGAGWAHERVLDIATINGWQNNNALPLFVTATCEFSRFDDPTKLAGGERILLNPEGGGIALLTTVRLVYSGANARLTRAFYSTVFNKKNGEYPRIGEVFMDVKNETNDPNSRNFTLMGDPALRLAFPEYEVRTTRINERDIAVNDTVMDTVKALQKVTIEGYIADENGAVMEGFNGTLYPSVFDKASDITTLNNDDAGTFNFQMQNNKLFKGRVSVVNGTYKFSFIVPKDISYNFGRGRISHYAENRQNDGAGYSDRFIVGGTDANAAEDTQGPMVDLFLNDETFVYGGITDGNPVLIANIQDLHGINMAGTGIGHDITATLDGKSDDVIILNDFYEADLDSYQRGKVRYQFDNLAEGHHTLDFKVWDVYNNSTEVRLEFVVEKDKDIVIERVLNYPNPFTTNTEFWFEHNQPNQILDVKIQVFTVSGKVVKTIDQTVQTEGYSQNRQNPIVWNGTDDYGDRLGRGVYIYKVEVRSRSNGSRAEKIEKLVIL